MRSHPDDMAVKIRPPLVYPRNKDLVQSERTNRVSVAGLFVGGKSTEGKCASRREGSGNIRRTRRERLQDNNVCRQTEHRHKWTKVREKGICNTVVLFGANESKRSNRRIGWQIAPNLSYIQVRLHATNRKYWSRSFAKIGCNV